MDAAGLVDALARLRVAVVGDTLLDAYLTGSGRGLCREAPVPVVDLGDRRDVPGGAANAAVALTALGADVRLVGVVGDDDEGRRLVRALAERGVAGDDLVVVPGRGTTTKARLVADGQLVARLDATDPRPLDPAAAASVAERAAAAAEDADVVLVSDYGGGALEGPVVERLVADRPRWRGVVVVDAKEAARWAPLRPDAIKPNWQEVALLLGPSSADRSASRAATVVAAAERVLGVSGASLAAVTLDEDGAVLLEAGRSPYRTYAGAAASGRTTGAGDTYTACLALALAAGAPTTTAAEAAAAAAGVVVAKAGTAACTARELLEALAGASKVLAPAEVAEVVGAARERGRRVVLTNGCFDLLHRGHVTYLSRAKALGDVLVVGVNDDAGVARLKGPGHPLNPLEDRLGVLAALSCVDHVVPFAGDTAVDLVDRVRPDVYVKGGDHAEDDLPEAPVVRRLGGRVELVDYVEDRSTSRLISRIRADASLA